MIMYDNQLKTKEKKILTKDKIDSSVQSVMFSPIIIEKKKNLLQKGLPLLTYNRWIRIAIYMVI